MAESFVFVGNSKACVPLATNLLQAGYVNAESVDAADAVLVYCLGQSLHEDVFFEEQGLMKIVQPGTLIVDLSPAAPGLAEEIFAVASLSGVDYVEAPISLVDVMAGGGYQDPANVLVRYAGETAPCEAALPLLEAISSNVVRCGEAGRAQLAKCAESLQVGARMASAVEAQALLNAASEAVGKPVDDISAIAFANADESAAGFLAAIAGRAYLADNAYTVETLLAEMVAAQVAAEDLGMEFPHVQSVRYLAELLATAGGAALAPSALMLAYGEAEEGREFGVDWNRLGADPHQHEHECDCGHDHAGDCGCADYDYDQDDCECSARRTVIEDDDDDWEVAEDDGFALDFDGVDAFDAESYGHTPYGPQDAWEALGDEWTSN